MKDNSLSSLNLSLLTKYSLEETHPLNVATVVNTNIKADFII